MAGTDRKKGFNEEISRLFEELVRKKEEGIKDIEAFKTSIVDRIDRQIADLYRKKDFIAEIFLKREELKLQKRSVWWKIRRRSLELNLRYLASMPFIYIMFIPGILMHIGLELYHQVCFRLYRIPLVQSRDYFVFDRRLLPYLNWFEKINCFYCSYYTGLAGYLKEITGRTERYWCPIKHSRRVRQPHSQYGHFVDYSDGESLRREWEKLRDFSEKEKSTKGRKEDE